MRLLIIVITCFLLASCDSKQPGTEIPAGLDKKPLAENWRFEVQLPDVVLPVQLHLSNDLQSGWFINGAERVTVPEIKLEGNQLTLRFPSFNNTFDLVMHEQKMEGQLTLVKRGYEQTMPVTAVRGVTHRFSAKPEPEVDVTGRWEVTFTEEDGTITEAIGEFDQQDGKVVGTFLTPKGDYRYLEGEVDGKSLKLSTFDGAHAFVFTAEMNAEGELDGDFWSGTAWHESWTARKNYDVKLPDSYSLTYLKDGYDSLEFTFPDLESNPVSLDDEKYRGKVVLVTLSGSWCPNCADESVFLSDYFRKNRDRGLEVITLLYEHFEDFERSAQQGKALRDRYEIEYDLLVAGTSDKTQAAETLPMLNHVLAFPTMIFIDRKGQVRRIHTGFSGPGTGSYYTEFVNEFNELMDELLAENGA